MKLSTMKANPEALEGVWFDNLEGFGDFRVKVKSLDCPEADALIQKLFRTILGRRITRKAKDIPPPVRDYVYARAMVDVCVIDWENWEDDDGAPVAYNPDALAAFILMDAPEGIRDGKRIYKTPDRKAYNFEGKFLYGELLRAVQAVDAPDDEDDDEDEDGGDTEKNASNAGSGGAADSVNA